ncbi:Hypothetical_protein [Hexamita inflata]|uniref:Hypothetical_protein n=1 Tax=Hexamita inflata TaxID=28002 RepID=A0AA86UN70_9EUKA|nr:Hypothetical protein HINF_LOCUS49469 [Hexamita inflata]
MTLFYKKLYHIQNTIFGTIFPMYQPDQLIEILLTQISLPYNTAFFTNTQSIFQTLTHTLYPCVSVPLQPLTFSLQPVAAVTKCVQKTILSALNNNVQYLEILFVPLT